MSYLNGIFLEKENARRALRDGMRDAFFAEIGLPRLTDPMRIDATSEVQHAKVLELIGIARTLHGDEVSGLDMLESTLRQLAVGLPDLPIGCPNQLSLDMVSAEGMQRSNFDMTWAGWFDG
ncbi:hypothetical protein [Paracoccus aminovorans]|uniref:hypothetical protein n=1 Tax=Paracoccus aminovorans TaxID=34004 RepID=UPI000782D41B|nr:hypothetical protein [Paracoccus aminovorans]